VPQSWRGAGQTASKERPTAGLMLQPQFALAARRAII
jgi:hypothetical protein